MHGGRYCLLAITMGIIGCAKPEPVPVPPPAPTFKLFESSRFLLEANRAFLKLFPKEDWQGKVVLWVEGRTAGDQEGERAFIADVAYDNAERAQITRKYKEELQVVAKTESVALSDVVDDLVEPDDLTGFAMRYTGKTFEGRIVVRTIASGNNERPHRFEVRVTEKVTDTPVAAP